MLAASISRPAQGEQSAMFQRRKYDHRHRIPNTLVVAAVSQYIGYGSGYDR